MSESHLTTRMRALRVDIAPEIAERHIHTVLSELREPPVQSARPVPRSRTAPRRRLAGVLAISMILLFPVAALAAEETVPGDPLYVVKQSTEWVRELVGDGVAAQHRARELEISIDRGDPIDVIVERFDASIAAIDDADVALLERVERSRERVRRQYGIDLPPAERRQGPNGPAGPGRPDDSGPRSGTGTESITGTGGTASTTTSPSSAGSGGESPGGGIADDGGTTRSTFGSPDRASDPGTGRNRP